VDKPDTNTRAHCHSDAIGERCRLLVLGMACYAVLVCEDGSAAKGSSKCLFCRQVTQAKIERYRYENEFLVDDNLVRICYME
jgi:hypothetical protein